MATNSDDLTLQLIGLPAKSRAALAHKLIESLDEEESPDARKQWIEIAQRRARELDEGLDPRHSG